MKLLKFVHIIILLGIVFAISQLVPNIQQFLHNMIQEEEPGINGGNVSN